MMNKRVLDSLTESVGLQRISLERVDKEAHSKDRSFHTASLPDVVVWPKTTKEVSEVLKIANEYTIPVTAWGGGSSLEGNPIPTSGGIVLDMTQMNALLGVMADDLQARVQPGMIGEELDKKLKP